MAVSRVKPETFFKILKDFGELSTEIALQFPLEFYQGDSFVSLYKTIGSKTYSTIIIINQETSQVLVKGEQKTREEFISELINNYNGIELLENHDKKLILAQV